MPFLFEPLCRESWLLLLLLGLLAWSSKELNEVKERAQESHSHLSTMKKVVRSKFEILILILNILGIMSKSKLKN